MKASLKLASVKAPPDIIINTGMDKLVCSWLRGGGVGGRSPIAQRKMQGRINLPLGMDFKWLFVSWAGS